MYTGAKTRKRKRDYEKNAFVVLLLGIASDLAHVKIPRETPDWTGYATVLTENLIVL